MFARLLCGIVQYMLYVVNFGDRRRRRHRWLEGSRRVMMMVRGCTMVVMMVMRTARVAIGCGKIFFVALVMMVMATACLA